MGMITERPKRAPFPGQIVGAGLAEDLVRRQQRCAPPEPALTCRCPGVAAICDPHHRSPQGLPIARRLYRVEVIRFTGCVMPPTASPLPSPAIERWSLRLQLARPLQHSAHCGSMLRGAFGHALKALACRCDASVHRPDCPYQQIFEPRPPGDWPQRYRDCPPAYVITPPPVAVGQRQHLDFAFTLLGPTLEQRALVWQAWQRAASQGLGEAQVPARLQALGHEQHLPAAPNAASMHLQLTSPLLIKRKQPGQGLSQPLRPDELRIEDLLIALHRRLELTHRLYGVPATPLPALEEWLALGSSLRFAARLHEHHYARHSNRQQQRMPLYGLSGEIQLGGPLPRSLRDALVLGQWLHIGGKTALGLGGYRLMAAKAPTMRLTLEDSL